MGIIKGTLYKLSSLFSIKSFNKSFFSPYYHLVSNNEVPHIDSLYKFKDEKQFEKHMDFFLQHYKSISLNELTTLINNNSKLPRNAFFLNFDDGLSEIYHVVRPILKKKGLDATFFVCNSYVDNKALFYKHKISLIIDKINKGKVSETEICEINKLTKAVDNNNLNKRIFSLGHKSIETINKIGLIAGIDFDSYLKEKQPYLTSSQIQEMIEDGFCFGGHTVNHYPLDELSIEEQYKEIVDSINFVKECFGINYSTFSFPFSDKFLSRELFKQLFDYDQNLILFGNSGIVNDIDPRIIQRISFEKSPSNVEQYLLSEYIYGYYRKFTFQGKMVRK